MNIALPPGSLAKRAAVWVNRDTLLWEVPIRAGWRYTLLVSPEAGLEHGTLDAGEINLAYDPAGAGAEITTEFPYLSGLPAFRIAPGDFARLKPALKGQLALAAWDENGRQVAATGVQIGGALDALYLYTGPLGVRFERGYPILRLWAPTAQSVRLHLYPDAQSPERQVLPMSEDPQTGVWRVRGKLNWKGMYYLYEVRVYCPTTRRVETNLVTDPYSLSLSINSLRSQIIVLSDSAHKPRGWDRLAKPPLAQAEDIVLYELHVRDFSRDDPGVPPALRGTYGAFTVKKSNGMRHLRALARAGLTHIHLLPVFDITTVNEDKTTWQTPDESVLAALPPGSGEQARAVEAARRYDGFTWGYDPYHFSVPEGSYAVDPMGAGRVREFRAMVAGLNRSGLRVVMDVVYNHTAAWGQDPKSVLDQIVPGYYYRLNREGDVETSSCCPNTASERRMMEKLMIDSLLVWARDYKVDGFRFDLMGHHLLRNLRAIREALNELTLEKDGVDGKLIYLYGEGWDFGEMAGNARGVNASQRNLGGSGIGCFNDRLRDGVRGGGAFGDPRRQGFASGLFFVPNMVETRDHWTQRAALLEAAAWIQSGLAGGLKDFSLRAPGGEIIPAGWLNYNGQPAGYTSAPRENILYVSAHDNETLFDAVQIKAAESEPLTERIRLHNLALSLVMFGQGIPFFHAGDDLLRSKSLDRNSYDSGDWFNRLDWTGYSTWGAGLPITAGEMGGFYARLLSDPALKPSPEDALRSAAIFRENLRIRRSSPLFHLPTAEDIRRDLSFLNPVEGPFPGLIAMRLTDHSGLDPRFAQIVVVFNASPGWVTLSAPSAQGEYVLHPLHARSVDPRTRQALYDPAGFHIPGRTTAVYVIPR